MYTRASKLLLVFLLVGWALGCGTADPGPEDGLAPVDTFEISDIEGDWPEITDDPLAHWRKPCDEPTDCAGKVCVPDEVGTKVCSLSCSLTKDCPGDWVCTETSEEDFRVCTPPAQSLCLPCYSDNDCIFFGSKCINVGSTGKYCGIDCWNQPEVCPSGTACVEAVLGGSGPGSFQCVPTTNSCVCLPGVDGTDRPCEVKNQFGTCGGTQTCNGADGWSSCNAKIPAAETCDGKDNDCDGTTDDGMVDIPCEFNNELGTCQGFKRCKGAGGYGACDALQPVAELCDNLDNDCDGFTDEELPDSDKDGTLDCLDTDDDDDDVPDALDNCPLLANKKQQNQDGDALGDACDPDIDGDNTANELDCLPYDKTGNPKATEKCDGLDNDCDTVVDEIFPDFDYDNKADCVDSDDDDDGDPDESDCAPFDYLVSSFAAEECDGTDNNCNKVIDEGCGPVAVQLQTALGVVKGNSFGIKADIIIGGLQSVSRITDGKGIVLELGVQP
jgi:hypothetical protein